MLWSFFWIWFMLSTSGGCCKAPDFRNPYRPERQTLFMGTDLLWPFPGVMWVPLSIRGPERFKLPSASQYWPSQRLGHWGRCSVAPGLGGKLYQKTGEHHNWRRESMKLTISARGWRWEWCLCGLAAFFDHCPVEDFWTSKFRQWFVAGNWGW